MSNLSDAILELKCRGFLARLQQLSGGDPQRRLCAGAVGQDLGLPLGDTLEILARLQARGDLHRCGRLDPPDGPEVHLTAAGVMAGHSEAA